MLAVQNVDDLLEAMVHCASNPLRPADAGALASCSRRLHVALRASLAALRPQHEVATALAAAVDASVEDLAMARILYWPKPLGAEHMRMLGALMGAWMPRFEALDLRESRAGDERVCALFEGLGRGVAPRLTILQLYRCDIGPAGAAALAGALGAMPRLKCLDCGSNRVGDGGLAALAAALRRLAALEVLCLGENGICDAGVAALVGGLRARELPALKELFLCDNPLSDAGCAALAAALGDRHALPALVELDLRGVERLGAASDCGRAAVQAAMRGRAMAPSGSAARRAMKEACAQGRPPSMSPTMSAHAARFDLDGPLLPLAVPPPACRD